MAIKEKLDEAFAADKTVDAVFEIRALIENMFNVLQETMLKIDEIAGSASFADVDAEIKAEGVDIRKILKDAKEAMADHLDFISWKQPIE